MPTPDKDKAFIVKCYARLLETTLASYEHFCLLKKQPKGELDRYEAILKGAFQDMAKDLQELRKSEVPHMGPGTSHPRVDEILANIEREGIEAGVARIIVKTRYGVR
jgi:hypothetical protein